MGDRNLGEPDDRVVLISPHTVVQNLLPVDVEYKLVSRTYSFGGYGLRTKGLTDVDAGEIISGKSVDIVSAQQSLELVLTVAGRQSTPLVLAEESGSIDVGGLRIYFGSSLQDGVWRFALWAPYWLLNSRYPLLLLSALSQAEATSAALPMYPFGTRAAFRRRTKRASSAAHRSCVVRRRFLSISTRYRSGTSPSPTSRLANPFRSKCSRKEVCTICCLRRATRRVSTHAPKWSSYCRSSTWRIAASTHCSSSRREVGSCLLCKAARSFRCVRGHSRTRRRNCYGCARLRTVMAPGHGVALLHWNSPTNRSWFLS